MGGGLLEPTGAFGPALTKAEADKMKRSLQMRTLGGGVLGGLLGGALLGPVGALAGGYLGRGFGARSYFPTAPVRSAGSDNKGYGQKDQSSYGRDVQKESKQYDRAVKSGSPGLY